VSAGAPHLLSVNVGRPRLVARGGRTEPTAIWKQPVEGRVRARGVNLEGDEQADRSVHGGPDKAVYSYAREDYERWEGELGRELAPGSFGENLTTLGIDVSGAVIGERWRAGTVLLEVSQPRTPCWKLGVRMDDPRFIKRFAQAGRPGAYLRIVEEGELGAGDAVEVTSRPAHGVTVAEVAHAFLRDHSRAARLLEAPELTESWREWAAEATQRSEPRAQSSEL
jgi:MOSC domain-containing protein YiiM